MKSIKNAFKAVILGAREYAGLYISIVILQLLFSLFAVSAVSTMHSADVFYREAYDYDLEITDEEHLVTTLYNKLNTDTLADGGIASYTSHEIIELPDNMATLRVSLKEGREYNFRVIYYERYTPEGEYSLSPRYVYFNDIRSDMILNFCLLGALLLLLGVLVLAVTYSIRVNYYKFNYGIYLACGADSRMLYKTAFFECGAIFCLTLLPSAALGVLAACLVYHGSRVSLGFHIVEPIIFVLMALFTLSVAIRIPVKHLSGKSPLSLIRSDDNSDRVSSPRYSRRIFNKKYPWYYETLSFWRFRKYFVRLILSAVCFSALFMTGIYAGNMISSEIEADKTAFVISWNDRVENGDDVAEIYSDVEYFLPELLAIDGVERVMWETGVGLSDKADHVLLMPGTVNGRADYTIASSSEKDGYTLASNYCKYVSLDKLTLEMYERYYQVDYLDGLDTEKLLGRDGMVVVSESIYGDKHFNFEPGDKIVIASYSKGDIEDILLTADRDNVLREQINKLEFRYYEYTVGAVIRGSFVDDCFIVGLKDSDFLNITGVQPAITSLDISVDEDCDPQDVESVSKSIREELKYFSSDWSIAETDSPIYAIAYDMPDIPTLLYVASCLIMLVSPIVWVLTQIMFYRKREREFTLLRSFGARVSDIGKQHALSGGLLTLLGFSVTYCLSAAACYIIYRVFSHILPSLGFYESDVPFDKYVSVGTLLLCAAVSALCATLSELIPYLIYRRKCKKTDSVATISENNV